MGYDQILVLYADQAELAGDSTGHSDGLSLHPVDNDVRTFHLLQRKSLLILAVQECLMMRIVYYTH